MGHEHVGGGIYELVPCHMLGDWWIGLLMDMKESVPLVCMT